MAMNADGPEVVLDPYKDEVKNWGYQECQQHQQAVIDAVAAIHQITPSDCDESIPKCQQECAINAIRNILKGVDPSLHALILQKAQDSE